MDKLKEELRKIRGMGFKKAADHIFTYYGLWIAAIIFAVIFIISLTSTVIRNRLTVPVINVAVQNELDFFYADDISSLLKEAFPDATGFSEPLKCSFSGSGDETDMYAGIQLMAYIAAGDIDAVICDQATADYLTNSENGASVTDISGTVLGKKAAAAGLSPLYYVTYDFWEKQEEAAILLEAIRSQK